MWRLRLYGSGMVMEQAALYRPGERPPGALAVLTTGLSKALR
jgi:hypothetical protein